MRIKLHVTSFVTAAHACLHEKRKTNQAGGVHSALYTGWRVHSGNFYLSFIRVRTGVYTCRHIHVYKSCGHLKMIYIFFISTRVESLNIRPTLKPERLRFIITFTRRAPAGREIKRNEERLGCCDLTLIQIASKFPRKRLDDILECNPASIKASHWGRMKLWRSGKKKMKQTIGAGGEDWRVCWGSGGYQRQDICSDKDSVAWWGSIRGQKDFLRSNAEGLRVSRRTLWADIVRNLLPDLASRWDEGEVLPPGFSSLNNCSSL